jgi:PAS domain S-box-containing protein
MPVASHDMADPTLDTVVVSSDRAVGQARKLFRFAWRDTRVLIVVLACAMFAANTAIALVVVNGLRSSYLQVQSTQDALTTLYALDADMQQISRDHREFLLTGLPQFIAQYREARQHVLEGIAQIRTLTAASLAQQDRIDTIEQRIADDANAMNEVVALGPAGPDAGMLRQWLTRQQLAESVRDVIADMQQEERQLQATRIRTVQYRTDQMLESAVLQTLVSITLIGLLLYVIQNDRTARRTLSAERNAALNDAARALRQAAAERREMEEALRAREKMLRGLSDAIPQIAFVLNGDGSGEFINRRWHDYTDAPPTFSLNQGWDRLVHPDDLRTLRLRWRQALQETAPFVAEFRLRGKDGRHRWFLIHAVPATQEENGSQAHWAGTLTDIDDIRSADVALRASENRFRRIFEGSPFGMTLSEGNDRRILQANPAFCQMLGYRPDELIGRSLVELTHPDERPPVRLLPQTEDTDRSWRERETRYVTKHGTVVWARIRVAVFDRLGGSGPQLLAVVEDITRQREVDEALRQAQRMEAIGQLSGGLAHDFNNLLGVIIGNIECLLDTMADDPERAELAREVLDSALGGAELTRRLLAFGRRQALSPQRIDLGAQVARHVTLLARTLGRSIQVATEYAEDLWPTCADPSQIGDALLNLGINARDAMPHGGVLTIETHNDRVWPEDTVHEPDMTPGDYVVLAVSDTGIGMTPEVRARAVEPFFTTKGPGAGSGLGLSMIYGFVRQSGGYLKINSEVGIGTTVRIFLPRATGAEDMVTIEQARPGVTFGQGTILVVDDSPEMRQVAERHLRFLGYSVQTAESGPAALALLRTGVAVDLLFTDIAMPEGLNGFQLADAACQLRPGLKVVFTTGYAGMQGQGGAPDWQDKLIRKPYRRSELAEKIRTALAA